MPAKEELRQAVRDGLDAISAEVNAALRGENLDTLKKVLERTGRQGATSPLVPKAADGRDAP